LLMKMCIPPIRMMESLTGSVLAGIKHSYEGTIGKFPAYCRRLQRRNPPSSGLQTLLAPRWTPTVAPTRQYPGGGILGEGEEDGAKGQRATGRWYANYLPSEHVARRQGLLLLD
jgi:hypothetical protein